MADSQPTSLAGNQPFARAGLFHLAIPAHDLELAKQYYCQHLGCTVGRQSDRAAILDFFGHQVVLHWEETPSAPQTGIYPRHFGLIFANLESWNQFRDRLDRQQTPYHIPPRLRFPGQVAEHWSCFLADPSQNLLEFKYYSQPEAIFGAQQWNRVGDPT